MFDGADVAALADDDLSLPVGDAFEDSLATALTRIVTGSCPAVASSGGAQLLSADSQDSRRRSPGNSAAREFSRAY